MYSSIFKFNTYEVAERFHMNMDDYAKFTILLGDDELFWLVTNRLAIKLMKKGYEMA